jgi:cellulose synthase/poly-beta-1,6-N-acetylglucosamine synthase-like glycosyltransferase
MIITLEIVISVVLILLCLLLCVELLIGAIMFSAKQKCWLSPISLRNVVLIPAHNEDQVIANTLNVLKQQLTVNDSVVVVADNCTDNTVAICKEHQVIVVERQSTTEIGKGYALDFGTKWILENKDFDNLVLFDADCTFTKGSFEQLVQTAHEHQHICQSCYLMQAPEGEAKTKIAEFTWWIINAIRATGLHALSIGCHIQGSGIAFPKSTLAMVNFASGSIVEDLELGLKLSLAKNRVLFTPNSTVTSHFPDNQEGLEEQRKRWEHGHLDTVLKVPYFLFSAVKNRSVRAIFLVLDAAIPPLFAFILVLFGFLLLGGIGAFFGYTTLFSAVIMLLSTLTITLAIVWLLKGHKILTLRDIPNILRFIWGKFSIYFSFVTSKQTTWVKTTRDEKTDEKDSN